jgi:murein DD-endopeptidase MepM/ murein hydrolase activator NlpD
VPEDITPERGAESAPEQGKTFTQEEVNALVGQARTEERRKVTQRFSDYDDLKAKASEATTAEERIAELEKRHAAAEAKALRSDIAAKHGISPEDRDLFLTGADEETLTAQAQRLTQREADRKKQGNVAPREGGNPTPGTGDPDGLRDFTRNLFASAAADE